MGILLLSRVLSTVNSAPGCESATVSLALRVWAHPALMFSSAGKTMHCKGREQPPSAQPRLTATQ